MWVILVHNFSKKMTASNWSFTLNNFNDSDEEFLSEWNVSYIVYQKERGANGTIHIQGYVQLLERKSLRQLKQHLPRGHFEKSRGTGLQNKEYCTKLDTRVGDIYERGIIKSQGGRTDIKEIIQAIKENKSDIEIIDMDPVVFLKYYRGLDRIRHLYATKREWPMEVSVYWGASGSGKSRKALEEAGSSVYFVSKGDAGHPVWWDGYAGEESIIIDDFYGWLPWSFMLRLLDRYPFAVQTKGGTTNFSSKKIFITSNVRPEEWYKNIPNNDVTPLMRRINKIEKLT